MEILARGKSWEKNPTGERVAGGMGFTWYCCSSKKNNSSMRRVTLRDERKRKAFATAFIENELIITPKEFFLWHKREIDLDSLLSGEQIKKIGKQRGNWQMMAQLILLTMGVSVIGKGRIFKGTSFTVYCHPSQRMKATAVSDFQIDSNHYLLSGKKKIFF